MPDRGPIYTETLRHQPEQTWLVEPYNAATALLFVVVAGVWLVRLRGQYRSQAFLTYAAIVLAIGGVGGTLYHATRAHVAFLILEVLPIFLLAVSAVYWFVARLTSARWMALAYASGAVTWSARST